MIRIGKVVGKHDISTQLGCVPRNWFDSSSIKRYANPLDESVLVDIEMILVLCDCFLLLDASFIVRQSKVR
jgi:hypothetical protein